MTRTFTTGALLAATLALSTCGQGSGSGSLPAGYYITISGMTFAPADLHVPPGATVTVVNYDAMSHSVTSHGAQAFQAGAPSGATAFDTGQFPMGTAQLTVTAPPGTVIGYFCSFHRETMNAPASPTITVDASATPGPGPVPPSGGGMY